jgi:hypothetical protein
MKTQFQLLKNGNVAQTVWANATTKEIYPANRTPWGYNAHKVYNDEFYNKYGHELKYSQGKGNYKNFYYPASQMQKVGFQIVTRGSAPLW